MCKKFLFFKYKNSSDFFNDLRTCTRPEFFVSEVKNICHNFQFPVTRMSSTFYSVSEFEHRNLNSYFHLVILLPGDIYNLSTSTPIVVKNRQSIAKST